MYLCVSTRLQLSIPKVFSDIHIYKKFRSLCITVKIVIHVHFEDNNTICRLFWIRSCLLIIVSMTNRKGIVLYFLVCGTRVNSSGFSQKFSYFQLFMFCNCPKQRMSNMSNGLAIVEIRQYEHLSITILHRCQSVCAYLFGQHFKYNKNLTR